MKTGLLAGAVAAMAAGVSAGQHGHARRHAHEAFHVARDLMTGTAGAPNANATCGCTTIYTTITGEGTLYFPPTPTYTSMAAPPTTPPTVPTPFATTCPTPGVYTIPATTVTLANTTTVCAPATTSVPAGVNVVGGVTTVVETETTVICPYATTTTTSGYITSTILTTTYVCPSAGTYTIAPLTTTVGTNGTIVYPVPAEYTPGVYVQPEVVTTITETDYVVVCPFTAPAVSSSTSSSSVSTEAPAPAPTTSSVYVAPPAPASTSSSTTAVYVAPAPSSSSSSSGSSSGGSGSSSSSNNDSGSTCASGGTSGGSVGTSGDQWAMTYSPYSSSGGCLSGLQIGIDIAAIGAAGFKSVRVYSTDCSTLEYVGTAAKLAGMKMILGIYISDTGISGAQEQVSDIISWGQWSLVELIVVGNEAVFNNYCTGSALAGFISDCKSKFSSAGYCGQITTTEPLNVWQANTGALCDVVDIVGCNIHPFFNADVSAEDAGSFTASQLDIVDGLCSGKTGINLETGWPSAGTNNGAAVPGASQQATAVKGITSSCGGRSVIFSYTNDLWKSLGAFDCEQSWGAVHLF